MKLRSPQASRSLGRLDMITMITKDDLLAQNAIDSSMISPTTDAEGAANTVTPAVPDHDVDDENRVELGRARQRQSLVVPHDHPGLAGPSCEAVRRRRGRACVMCGTASAEGIRRGWFDTIRPQCERVPLILCARWLSPEPTDHVRYRTCADGTVRPPKPSAGVGTWSPRTGAP